jgi:thioester reductase-like protein
MAPERSYLLLTGATGLLGRSLLRDLAAAGRRVAVLVRGSRTADAAARVDELLADWQDVAGAVVECPVVLEGDITRPELGLDPAAAAWVARHVGDVVHSAASLSFERRPSDDEPYASNVRGTANVLEACRTAGIRRLHHVSSAYVCGLREGRILETELDVGQTPGNDYERSKIDSEKAAVTAPFLDVVTVHRPSIIVGDLVTGFTNTFHGFYKPLRIVQPFVEAFVQARLAPGSLLDVLGMSGREAKNLVPVDWVSAVMTRIIEDPAAHGRTYHLATDHPTPSGRLCRLFEELVVGMAAERAAGRGIAARAPAFDPATLGRLFGDQMHVYRAYWRDDPRFDTTHTRAFAPDLPAPKLDDETIRRLCRFAIGNGFRWPPPGRPAPAPGARGALVARLGAPRWSAAPAGPCAGLAVAGAGGGQWTLSSGGDGRPTWHVGLPAGGDAVVRIAAPRLAAACAAARPAGALEAAVIEGATAADRRLAADLLTAAIVAVPRDAAGDRLPGGRAVAAVN